MEDRTVSQIIEDTCTAICDDYCKWPERYGSSEEDLDRMYEERCYKCPLIRLC